jgi:hypothetical protein
MSECVWMHTCAVRQRCAPNDRKWQGMRCQTTAPEATPRDKELKSGCSPQRFISVEQPTTRLSVRQLTTGLSVPAPDSNVGCYIETLQPHYPPFSLKCSYLRAQTTGMREFPGIVSNNPDMTYLRPLNVKVLTTSQLSGALFGAPLPGEWP